MSDGSEPGSRQAAFLIGGRRVEPGTVAFADAIAWAHAEHEQPRCLCVEGGVEMYVARLPGNRDAFVVKRMPGTGDRHAADCSCYEPPSDASGLGQVLGSAINEDPATGETTLKLDFPLLKIGGRSVVPLHGGESHSVSGSGTRLSLRALLHYLWDQAGLTRWHPGFAGKRSWGVVRAHLLQAAEQKHAGGGPLRPRLYVPEPFFVEQREAINVRRMTQWSRAIAAPGQPQRLLLLIAEVKEIVPARHGFKVVVKHLPDQGLLIDDVLFRRLERRFGATLALWGGSNGLHMLMIATFAFGAAGVPTIHELCLMPVTREWLPIEDAFEQLLIERLVADGRSFVKGLRYNLDSASELASARVTDCAGAPVGLFVARVNGKELAVADPPSGISWVWRPFAEPMPDLPPRRGFEQANERCDARRR